MEQLGQGHQKHRENGAWDDYIALQRKEFAPGTPARSPRSPRLTVSEARRAEFAKVECSASAEERCNVLVQ